MSKHPRLQRLQQVMAQKDVDLVVLWPSANWAYLVGHAPIAVERPTFLMVSRDHVCAVVPAFDQQEMIDKTGLTDVFAWSDAQGPQAAIKKALHRVAGGKVQTMAMDDTLPFGYLKALEPCISGAQTRLASEVMMVLRRIKDPEEIAAIRKTAGLIERVLDRADTVFTCRVTEKQVELNLKALLLEAGAGTLDFVLVQTAPNSASPHHLPGSAVVKEGEPVLLDIAVSADGYFADITRQVCIGRPGPKYEAIYAIVRRAQEAALEAVKPGLAVAVIDRTARGIISEAGMGPFFTTRTGHGLGLEVHEPPSVAEGCDLRLEPGMVFTIEPGIYLPGEFGIRIEDTVAVTEQGVERLTVSDRELRVL